MSADNSKIDPNTASIGRLMEVKSIGPELAKRIITARPFENVNGLLRVNGIGENFLNNIRPEFEITSENEKVSKIDVETHVGSYLAEEAQQTEASDQQGEGGSEEIQAERSESWVEGARETAFSDTNRETWEEALEEKVAMEAGTGELESSPELVLNAVGTKANLIPPKTQEKPATRKSELDRQASETPPLREKPAANSAPREEAKKVETHNEKIATRPVGMTRIQSLWISVAVSFFTLMLALFLTLGILAGLNSGQLQYSLPSQYNALDARAKTLESQVGNLGFEIEGMRTRIDNLETLGDRIGEVEQTTETLRAELEAASSQINELSNEITTMRSEVEATQEQLYKYQSFFEGLRELITNLFTEEVSQ